MQELRFFYNPISKKFLKCNYEHAITWHNKGYSVKSFDKQIRGIIKDNILYLRLYYPLPDISERSLEEVKQYSFNALFDSKQGILKALKDNGIKKPSKINYNVVNEDLKGILTNI
jgi:hypothetical protein